MNGSVESTKIVRDEDHEIGFFKSSQTSGGKKKKRKEGSK
jgi:hypothetical protein